MKLFISLSVWLIFAPTFAQSYNSYFTGNSIDAIVNPNGGVCLMGGASEDDNAMTWFLQQANGGDILVLRTSGSDGYNDYFYSTLGVTVNSVETIVCNSPAASNESYVQERIEKAEAIWFAGGDQWDYISFWRDTPVDSLINVGISDRDLVIGGTSAGMAIQGGYYFSAENGTVTSATALSDPYDSNVTADGSPFLTNQYLENVIMDTHYDNPDRKGRHAVFLARILTDSGVQARGIACDEYTAICVQTDGIAKVFGQHPTYDDNAYFIQPNCELSDPTPENCSSGNALTWDKNGTALKVYSVKGTSNGSNTFDLTDWKTGVGGTWRHWSVSQGNLLETAGTAPNCALSFSSEISEKFTLKMSPNPSADFVRLRSDKLDFSNCTLKLRSATGEFTEFNSSPVGPHEIQIDLSKLATGIYFLTLKNASLEEIKLKLVKK